MSSEPRKWGLKERQNGTESGHRPDNAEQNRISLAFTEFGSNFQTPMTDLIAEDLLLE